MSENEALRDGSAGRVVVGIDGSPASLEALREAARIASWRNWTVQVIHAWHINYPVSPFVLGVAELATAAKEFADEKVEEAEKIVREEFPEVVAGFYVEEGPAAPVLIDHTAGAELLVLGSRGLGGFSSVLLGSVGEACAHHAHCPVLILRPKIQRAAA